MLIKGHFPEELSARPGPACSGRLCWLICKEAITLPPGNGSEFRLKSSLQYCVRSSLRRQCCSHPGRGCWLTWEPAPETVGRTEMQGFLRRKRRILISCHSWACKSQTYVDITKWHAHLEVAFPQWPENQNSSDCKPTRLDQHDPLGLANPPARRGPKPARRDPSAQPGLGPRLLSAWDSSTHYYTGSNVLANTGCQQPLTWPWLFCLQCFQRMKRPPGSHLHPAELHPVQPEPWEKWLGPHSLWSSGWAYLTPGA